MCFFVFFLLSVSSFVSILSSPLVNVVQFIYFVAGYIPSKCQLFSYILCTAHRYSKHPYILLSFYLVELLQLKKQHKTNNESNWLIETPYRSSFSLSYVNESKRRWNTQRTYNTYTNKANQFDCVIVVADIESICVTAFLYIKCHYNSLSLNEVYEKKNCVLLFALVCHFSSSVVSFHLPLTHTRSVSFYACLHRLANQK